MPSTFRHEDESVCGDGVLDEVTEECDDGNTESGDGCDAHCNEEIELVKTPVQTCTGVADLFTYQKEQEQPIATSFVADYDQVLVMTRSSASLEFEVERVGLASN